jgi:DNA repair photolyase
MKIGITERGDAGLDFSWVDKLSSGYVDGAILITKNINDKFINNVITLYNMNAKIILHCTVTGFGGTKFEPNVPNYKVQIDNLKKMLTLGFPSRNCVLRIDPIFPTDEGLEAVKNVVEYAKENVPDINRIRISIFDEYNHVKKRFINAGVEPLYKDIQCSDEQKEKVNNFLNDIFKDSEFELESCAENIEIAVPTGCVSEKDLNILDLQKLSDKINPQNRSGCLCLNCKTELLNNKKRCPHQCLYCFWID